MLPALASHLRNGLRPGAATCKRPGGASSWRFASTLRIAGVPEHFNAPFHIAQERGLYADRGVDLEWCMTPEGTGAMLKALEAGETDMAVVLSEGAVARVASGAALKVVGTYVKSPLRWGVHVKAGSPLRDLEALRGRTFGISRPLSGSHLMAHVMANSRGWTLPKDAPVKVVGPLDGARKAMAAEEIDAWLWEKFTTKHLVDSGEWDIIGEVPTPWPCFLFVASRQSLATKSEDIRSMVEVTRGVCEEFKANSGGSTVGYVAQNHKLSEEDATEWLNGTEWACDLEVQVRTLNSTQQALGVIGQLNSVVAPESLIEPSLCSLVE